MSLPITENFNDLFNRPLLCAFTTINPDGQPHTVPVWCDFDGEHVRINAPTSTKKARNLRTNKKVSVFILDPESAWHWIEIQGQVIETRDEAHGARDHINKLSEKYTGNPVYQDRGGVSVDREMYVIDALKINGR